MSPQFTKTNVCVLCMCVLYVPRISQAHSPPNHNALLHLSINPTHLHVISTLISQHSHLTPSHCPILFSSKWTDAITASSLLTFCLISSVFLPALLHHLVFPSDGEAKLSVLNQWSFQPNCIGKRFITQSFFRLFMLWPSRGLKN